MSMYREQIMDHYKHPRNFGELPNADVVLDIDNPLCGDKLKLQIKFNACEQIQDVKFSGAGCAISVASASLLTEYLKNKTRAELLAIDEDVIYKLLGVEINAGRTKCALLPLSALQEILKKKIRPGADGNCSLALVPARPVGLGLRG